MQSFYVFTPVLWASLPPSLAALYWVWHWVVLNITQKLILNILNRLHFSQQTDSFLIIRSAVAMSIQLWLILPRWFGSESRETTDLCWCSGRRSERSRRLSEPTNGSCATSGWWGPSGGPTARGCCPSLAATQTHRWSWPLEKQAGTF